MDLLSNLLSLALNLAKLAAASIVHPLFVACTCGRQPFGAGIEGLIAVTLKGIPIFVRHAFRLLFKERSEAHNALSLNHVFLGRNHAVHHTLDLRRDRRQLLIKKLAIGLTQRSLDASIATVDATDPAAKTAEKALRLLRWRAAGREIELDAVGKAFVKLRLVLVVKGLPFLDGLEAERVQHGLYVLEDRCVHAFHACHLEQVFEVPMSHLVRERRKVSLSAQCDGIAGRAERASSVVRLSVCTLHTLCRLLQSLFEEFVDLVRACMIELSVVNDAAFRRL